MRQGIDNLMTSKEPATPPPTGKPRPPVLRALGTREPPEEVEIAGESYRRRRTFKHDSWAATALYVGPRDRQVVCKFNRQQPILGIPMGWLGRRLARREASFLNRLQDTGNVPAPCAEICVGGKPLRTAVGHDFVPGSPLRRGQKVSDQFFDQLQDLLATMHARGIAYVDLHKGENILVGADHQPYLIDFQISVMLPRVWPATLLLHVLTGSDRYHVAKHLLKHRPDLCDDDTADLARKRPWWIRLHRLFAVPLREARRRLLVQMGVRKGRGRATSEHFPEEGLRCPS